MLILKQQVNSSSNFASFFIVMTHNSSVNFKLIHFLLWIKGSHQSPNFETFECAGENLRNSSCHLPNLHHSSVSCKITHPYFFRSNVIYFGQKEPIRVEPFETFVCSGQKSKTNLWFKYDMRDLVNFHPTNQKSENFTSMGSFCPKYITFELK